MSSIEGLQQACLNAETYLALNPSSRAAQGDLQRARSRLWAARNQELPANSPEARPNTEKLREPERIIARRAEAEQRRAKREARVKERTEGRKAWLETMKAKSAVAQANWKAAEEKEVEEARARAKSSSGPKAGFGEELESEYQYESSEETEPESNSNPKAKSNPKSRAGTEPRFKNFSKFGYSPEHNSSAKQEPRSKNGKFEEEFRSSFHDFESSKYDLYGSKGRLKKAQSDAESRSRYKHWNNASETQSRSCYRSWNNASETFFNTSAPFPRPPPYTCNKKYCIKAERLGTCHHGIQILLQGSRKYSKTWLKTERLRWHPDKFAKDKQENISEAQEMFQMIQRLIDGGKEN